MKINAYKNHYFSINKAFERSPCVNLINNYFVNIYFLSILILECTAFIKRFSLGKEDLRKKKDLKKKPSLQQKETLRNKKIIQNNYDKLL